MFFNRKEPCCANGCFIPYKYMEIYEIDKIGNNNMFRVSLSFIALVVLLLLIDTIIGHDMAKANLNVLIIMVLVTVVLLCIFCLSFYGLLRIYCYLSEGACPSCCQKCFYICCINPNFDEKYEIEEV